MQIHYSKSLDIVKAPQSSHRRHARLRYTTKHWGYVEFYALSVAIGYSTDFSKTLEFFVEALEVLSYEEYV